MTQTNDEHTVLTQPAQALTLRGHEVTIARDKAHALAIALEMIGQQDRVALPGSLTVRQVGLDAALKKRGTPCFDHWDCQGVEKNEIHLHQRQADWLILSANAVTNDGLLISCDGYGNRVACMAWGPKRHLYLIGQNKLTPNLPTALNRIREYAAIQNALRFKPELADDDEGLAAFADQICRVFTILDKPTSATERSVVILIAENLGY